MSYTKKFLEDKAKFLSKYLPKNLEFQISNAYGKNAIHLIDGNRETYSVYKELTAHCLTVKEAVNFLEFAESLLFSAFTDSEIMDGFIKERDDLIFRIGKIYQRAQNADNQKDYDIHKHNLFATMERLVNIEESTELGIDSDSAEIQELKRFIAKPSTEQLEMFKQVILK